MSTTLTTLAVSSESLKREFQIDSNIAIAPVKLLNVSILV